MNAMAVGVTCKGIRSNKEKPFWGLPASFSSCWLHEEKPSERTGTKSVGWEAIVSLLSLPGARAATAIPPSFFVLLVLLLLLFLLWSLAVL